MSYNLNVDFVKPDLTKKEQEESKKLYTELIKLRSENPNKIPDVIELFSQVQPRRLNIIPVRYFYSN